MCPLCELKTILHIYDESDPRWIIMDCMSCILPMSVWRGEPQHTMSISEKDAAEMEEALSKIGEEKFGKGKFFIDKVQRQVPDHLHWHARPIEDEIKIKKSQEQRKFPEFSEKNNQFELGETGRSKFPEFN